jgi:hypothetical protein
MKLLRRALLVCLSLALAPHMLRAVTITIADPATGSGAVWDCSVVDGTTTGCLNGSPVSGALWRAVYQNGQIVDWSLQRPCGPLYLTSSDSGFWATSPDFSNSVALPNGQISISGYYKVKVTVIDNGIGMATANDEHFWTVP